MDPLGVFVQSFTHCLFAWTEEVLILKPSMQCRWGQLWQISQAFSLGPASGFQLQVLTQWHRRGLTLRAPSAKKKHSCWMFVHTEAITRLIVCLLVRYFSLLQRFMPCWTPSSLLTPTSASTPLWTKMCPWTKAGWRSSISCRPRESVTWRGMRKSWIRSLASSLERKPPCRGWPSGQGSELTCTAVRPQSCRNRENDFPLLILLDLHLHYVMLPWLL